MTNHWVDLRNSDVFLIIGSNAAENHPISFKWITEAIEQRGAKLISVDPRFTRTSARAHIYAPLRPGTDVAFMGGMINYILQHDLIQKEYVQHYTNATFLINEKFDFKTAEGLFSGYDPEKRAYDNSSWAYQLDENKIPKRDMSMKDPHCVYQLLKKFYARYDMETVSKITGTPIDLMKQVYETYASSHPADKSATIMYAMGTTQHTHGTQNIRSYVIAQLLMGNIGVAGGGNGKGVLFQKGMPPEPVHGDLAALLIERVRRYEIEQNGTHPNP